tara:strand:+ start:57 stop:236 length:180 start_codon:yes stop_codon:yes gene_type:complete
MQNKTRDKFRTKVPITVDKILKYIKKTKDDNKYGYSNLLFVMKTLLNLEFRLLNIKNVI